MAVLFSRAAATPLTPPDAASSRLRIPDAHDRGSRGLQRPRHRRHGQDIAARDLESEAAGIDAQVFDLKAVNPNAVAKVDDRTPVQIIQNIEAQGRIVAQALTRLNALLSAEELSEGQPATMLGPSKVA